MFFGIEASAAAQSLRKQEAQRQQAERLLQNAHAQTHIECISDGGAGCTRSPQRAGAAEHRKHATPQARRARVHKIKENPDSERQVGKPPFRRGLSAAKNSIAKALTAVSSQQSSFSLTRLRCRGPQEQCLDQLSRLQPMRAI